MSIWIGDTEVAGVGPPGSTGPTGPSGPSGADGTSVAIIGSVANAAALPAGPHTTGDGWITEDDGHLHVWNGSAFVDVGTVRGPSGPSGPAGTDASGGIPSAASFTDGALTDSVIDTCEATTGWVGVGTGSTPALNSTYKTQGSNSVQSTLQVGNSLTRKFYRNLTANSATTGRDRLLVDFNYSKTSGATIPASSVWQLKVADAVDLGGNVVTVAIPKGIANNQWITIVVPLGALANVRSFGVTATAGGIDPVSSSQHIIRFDNIRFASLSKLDAAFDGTTNVVVPDDYTSTVTQAKRVPSSIAEIDLRRGREHIGRLGGVRHIREWNIPEDGLTEVSADLNAALNEAGTNTGSTKVVFAPGGLYWCDTPITLDSIADLEIDGQGAALFTRVFRGGNNNVTDDLLSLATSRRLTIRNLRLYGYRDTTTTGNLLINDRTASAVTVDATADTVTAGFSAVNDDRVVFTAATIPAGLVAGTIYFVVGTPTASTTFQVATTSGGTAINITSTGTTVTATRYGGTAGTTVKLNQQSDTFRAIYRGNGGSEIAPFYARYPLIMFPTATRTLIGAYDSTFTVGNAFVATLSDSAQIASDCVLEAVDAYDGTTIASRTLTLTSTPTDYVLAFTPADLHRNYKVRVRKATATANTITVTQLVEYGLVSYDGAHDSADAIRVLGSRDITLEDITVEGAATDGLDVLDVNTSDLDISGFTSRACSRQGVSFNRGSRIRFLNFSISETGRSGIDIEPFNWEWVVDTLEIGDGQISNVTNYALAPNNWALIRNLHLHDIYWNGCGVGGFIGGARGAIVADIGGTANNRVYTHPGTSLAVNGVDMKVRGLACDANIVVGSTTGTTIDDTGFVAATVDPTADTVTLTNNDFYVTNGDRVYLRSTVVPGGTSQVTYYVVGTPTYATTFQIATTLGGTAINITSAGTAVTAARVINMVPVNNDVEAKCIGDYYGQIGSAGRGNQLRIQAQGTIATLTAAVTGNVGFDIPQDASGAYELNKQTQWPRSHGRRFASELPTVIGGFDLNGQALSSTRAVQSDSRASVAVLASAARTTGATTAATDLGARGQSGRLTVACSAASGTTASLNVTVEVSQDSSNWYTASTLRAITAASQVSVPLRDLERYIRLTYTILGGSPSFTFSATLDYASLTGNNLSGRLTLGSGVTTGTVVFPSPAIYPTIGSVALTAVTGGSLSAATYYYRCGGRTRRAGPKTWDVERSAVVSGANNAVRIRSTLWHNIAGVFTEGLTILRGTATGVYDTRYDVLPAPNYQLFQTRHTLSDWTDLGTSVTADFNNPAFPTTRVTSGGPYAVVDESGWEPDALYRVIVTPSWLTTHAATTRRPNGFDLTFGTATPDASQYVDWMLVR